MPAIGAQQSVRATIDSGRLKRLGLLTPRVRDAFDKLDILRFENEKDSIEEPEVAPPEELVKMMMQYMAEHGPQARS